MAAEVVRVGRAGWAAKASGAGQVVVNKKQTANQVSLFSFKVAVTSRSFDTFEGGF